MNYLDTEKCWLLLKLINLLLKLIIESFIIQAKKKNLYSKVFTN